jgi:hypothetical protein
MLSNLTDQFPDLYAAKLFRFKVGYAIGSPTRRLFIEHNRSGIICLDAGSRAYVTQTMTREKTWRRGNKTDVLKTCEELGIASHGAHLERVI